MTVEVGEGSEGKPVYNTVLVNKESRKMWVIFQSTPKRIRWTDLLIFHHRDSAPRPHEFHSYISLRVNASHFATFNNEHYKFK